MIVNRPRVLAVADGMIPSVELVLKRPFEYLEAQGHLTCALHTIDDPTLPLDLTEFDVLLLMRVYQPQAAALAQAAQLAGLPLIYIIDDDFSALDPATPLGRHYRDAGAWQRILDICASANVVWTFSESLVEKIRTVQPRVAKLPAIANLELIDSLRSTLGGVPTRAKVIGYAGSLTHAEDLASIARPLHDVLDAHPEWSMEIINVDPGVLARHPRVRHFRGLDSVERYYRFVLQRAWSIGVAPLLRNAANDAKTDNKYREYATLGIAGVYSPAPPYAGSVAHGITGLYAEHPDDWRRSLSALIAGADLHQRIVAHARQDVQARYSMAVVASRYLDCVHAVLRPPSRVLVIAPAIPSVEIDVTRPFARLRNEGLIDWDLKAQEEVADGDLSNRDCVVVVRYSDPTTARLVRYSRETLNLPTVYSWDDDFFEIPAGLGAITDYYRSELTLESLANILRDATVVKASTRRLADRSRRFSRRVTVSPYGFDFDQFSGPGAWVAERDKLVIGFFGNHTHGYNLSLLHPVLTRIAAEFPECRFEIFGPNSTQLRGLPRATYLPWTSSSQDSINSLRDRRWSIGLAPLEDNEFNRAKLPTKYRDYSACGVAGVYSTVDPYTDNVVDGETGLLAGPDADSWYRAIKRLIDDPELRRQIAANAYLHVRDTLSVDVAVTAWRRIFESLDIEPDRHAATRPEPDAGTAEPSDERVRALEKRVRLLQVSARHLLEQKRQLEGGKLGRLRRWVQKIRGPSNMHRDRSPAFAHFVPAPGAVDESCVHLELSANLQVAKHVEYPIPAPHVDCVVVEAAVSLPVPTLPGRLTLEVVSRDGGILHSESLPIDEIDPFEPLRFPVGNSLAIAGPEGRLRFSAERSFSPIHLFQMRNARTGETLPFLGFIKAGGT